MVGMPVARITGLNVHPVKSCRGFSVERWELDDFGFRHDRRWLVVDEAGRFMSQREFPRMALIRTAVAGDRLVLSAPGRESLELPLAPAPVPARPVVVWRDEVLAEPQGDRADDWLSGFLERPASLVYMPGSTVRRVNPEYSPEFARVGFADAYPATLVSQEALDRLNAKLGDVQLPMNRFRMNVVIEGAGAHAEDAWRRLRLGAIPFDVVKPCGRCVITTTDQQTAERNAEPLATLSTYRRDGTHVNFGQNLVHRAVGWLEVGAPVEVLESAVPV